MTGPWGWRGPPGAPERVLAARRGAGVWSQLWSQHRGEAARSLRPFRILPFRFMEDLQTEVQEMEFLQFSKGLRFMRKEDFAEWLLFFTNTENKDIYWKNVREKLSAGEVGSPFLLLTIKLRQSLRHIDVMENPPI